MGAAPVGSDIAPLGQGWADDLLRVKPARDPQTAALETLVRRLGGR